MFSSRTFDTYIRRIGLEIQGLSIGHSSLSVIVREWYDRGDEIRIFGEFGEFVTTEQLSDTASEFSQISAQIGERRFKY